MCIYTGDNTLILRETMKDLEKRLDPRRFQRVHRSTIVNLDLVKQVKPHTNGECFLVLDSGAQVKVSRSYRDVVARFVAFERKSCAAMFDFAALHVPGDPLILYNAWDAGSAKAAERAGAKAVATGSWSVAAATRLRRRRGAAARPGARQRRADGRGGRRCRCRSISRVAMRSNPSGVAPQSRAARRDRRGRLQFRGSGDRRRRAAPGSIPGRTHRRDPRARSARISSSTRAPTSS